MDAKIITLSSRSVLWFSTKPKTFGIGRVQVAITAATTSITGTNVERLNMPIWVLALV
jgi:hypothetical protein